MKNIILISALLAFGVSNGSKAADCVRPTIAIDAENMTGDDERIFEQDLRRAIAKVCRWWGATYTGPFTVNIVDSRGPSMALVPGWRGNRGTMLFRSRITASRRSAITHEVIHVFAPNANRFLAEGLAVYAHEHLKGRSAYPNFGADLHEMAKEFVDWADFSELDDKATPKRLRTGDLDGRDAYVVAGSFVRFLIETHGMENFRKLYAMTPMIAGDRNGGSADRWKSVYGTNLTALGNAWKAKMRQ